MQSTKHYKTMKYQVFNQRTGEIESEFYTLREAEKIIEFEFDWNTHTIIKFIGCRGCEQEGHERHDWYGISTGHWCDECYESDRYPYKRTRYATEEFDGYGERLDDNY
jgi:hypothetical protein